MNAIHIMGYLDHMWQMLFADYVEYATIMDVIHYLLLAQLPSVILCCIFNICLVLKIMIKYVALILRMMEAHILPNYLYFVDHPRLEVL